MDSAIPIEFQYFHTELNIASKMIKPLYNLLKCHTNRSLRNLLKSSLSTTNIVK